MTLKTLAVASCFAICTATATATAGFAATFTVGSTDYDFTTITGSFDDNSALLTSQVWWGDRDLALEFADAVSVNLPGNAPNYGPYLAYAPFQHANDLIFIARFSGFFGDSDDTLTHSDDNSLRFAVATPLSAVPLPAGGLLLLSAFGGVAALNRRKKRAA